MRIVIVTTLVTLGLAALTACSSAQPSPPSIEIQNAWARPTSLSVATPATETPGSMPAMGMDMSGVTSAIYVEIDNRGGTPDRLRKVESDAAQAAELHQTQEENGMMLMKPVSAIDIPANGSARLEPGGFHIMLIGLKRDLKVGDQITLTLTFERSGPRTVSVTVRDQ